MHSKLIFLMAVGLFVVGLSSGVNASELVLDYQNGVQVAQADDDEDDDEENTQQEPAGEENVSEESKEAKEKVTGFMGKVTSVWNGITGTIGGMFGALRSSLDSMFGFEKGEGPQALFGGAVYLIILIVLLFFLVFIYNILRDIVKSIFSSGNEKPNRKRRR